MARRLFPTLLAAALAVPSAAAAADTTVAADPNARQVTALDGTIVWVSDTADDRQVLMQSTAAGVARVAGAPAVRSYRTIDLGHDRDGELVLTYQRCDTRHCVSYRDDLGGHRSIFRGMAIRNCSLSTAPSLWGRRAAYGLACHKGRTADPKRSGLYVRTGAGTPRHLPRPRDVAKFGITDVSSVDLGAKRVAAIFADIYSYAVSETIAGKAIRSFLAGASEGESDAHVPGLALTPSGALWALAEASHTGDPNETLIYRLAGGCHAYENLMSEPDVEGYRATDLAVDRGTLYLVVPGTGIVSHPFTPARPCD